MNAQMPGNFVPETVGLISEPARWIHQCSTNNPQLYHLDMRMDNGSYRRYTGFPMTHKECCIMKSKFSARGQARLLFVPVDSIAAGGEENKDTYEP